MKKTTKPKIEATVDLSQIEDDALATLAAFAHASDDGEGLAKNAIGDEGSEEDVEATNGAFDLTAFEQAGDEEETSVNDEAEEPAALGGELSAISAADFAFPLPDAEADDSESAYSDDDEAFDLSSEGEDTDDEPQLAFDPEKAFAGAEQSDEDEEGEDEALDLSGYDDEVLDDAPKLAFHPETAFAGATLNDEDEEGEEAEARDGDELALAPSDFPLPTADRGTEDEALELSSEEDEVSDDASEIAFDPETAFAGAAQKNEDEEKEDAADLVSLLDDAALAGIAEETLDEPSETPPAMEALPGLGDEPSQTGLEGPSEIPSPLTSALDAVSEWNFGDEDAAEEKDDVDAADDLQLKASDANANDIAFAEDEEPQQFGHATTSLPWSARRRVGLADHCSADRHLGLWAAAKLGHHGEEAEEGYARSIVLAGILTVDASGGLDKVIEDLTRLDIHPETVRTRYELILTSLRHDRDTVNAQTGDQGSFAG
ncbi:MAG: DUF1476 family protein [Fulvimarina manganoxydans]|uniref:ATPase inhibitor subunit zeta n=1 Tax=Fulvimarina manganoxydans TaxID=937218 RepID=UPI002353A840|nr:ATPase inhibitor subunit zeta [Fulvimarina manganoxydans]MCK5932795.1 DUF1476 family protein [Fulvimarina manganoxydans]